MQKGRNKAEEKMSGYDINQFSPKEGKKSFAHDYEEGSPPQRRCLPMLYVLLLQQAVKTEEYLLA